MQQYCAANKKVKRYYSRDNQCESTEGLENSDGDDGNESEGSFYQSSGECKCVYVWYFLNIILHLLFIITKELRYSLIYYPKYSADSRFVTASDILLPISASKTLATSSPPVAI
jgi:hypothetical protein